jgi:hypothetical protein
MTFAKAGSLQSALNGKSQIAKDLIFIFLGFAGKFFRIRGKYEFMPEVRVLSQTTSHLNSGS